MSDLRDDVSDLFAALTGREPDGLWSAPGRVNLLGDHTDYHDGFALPFAIDRRTLAAVPGVDLVLDSNVPVGAGLSSSAALESAVALALDDLWRLGMSHPALAQAGRLAENDFVGAPTGILDQTAAMLGRRDAALLLDSRSLATEYVDLGLEAAGLAIVVLETGESHSHATGGYGDRRAESEAAAVRLGATSLRDLGIDDLVRARATLDDLGFRRVRHVVSENARVLEAVRLLRADGPTAIGALLDASHASLRDDYEVSTPELDLAVETARENGALGARMTGGGFGGSAIALAPVDAISRIQVALDGAFSEHGFAQPEVYPVRPSDGATRDR